MEHTGVPVCAPARESSARLLLARCLVSLHMEDDWPRHWFKVKDLYVGGPHAALDTLSICFSRAFSMLLWVQGFGLVGASSWLQACI